eukprot:TRINITY_DN7117_c0_g1_i1.p1 TRINITY_DN7117_c0_g1~~TRINITY_DN7117_c0_g1_i1.p1  ORF type:complete len:244 (+),score=66.50 TRINITY_DN7117_c0_g1_i1:450-1181(+)
MCAAPNVDKKIKAIVVGNPGVGKSTLGLTYVNGEFTVAPATIGQDAVTKYLTIDGIKVQLDIWDTAGQERTQSIQMAFYRQADCCILAYAVDDKKSFNQLANWILEVKKRTGKTLPTFIVATKVDLPRVVSEEEALDWCQGLPYFETSAMSKIGVNSAFEHIVRRVLSAPQPTPSPAPVPQNPQQPPPQNTQQPPPQNTQPPQQQQPTQQQQHTQPDDRTDSPTIRVGAQKQSTQKSKDPCSC